MAKQPYKAVPGEQALRGLMAFAEGDIDDPLPAATSGFGVAGVAVITAEARTRIRRMRPDARRAAAQAVQHYLRAAARTHEGTIAVPPGGFPVREIPLLVDDGTLNTAIDGAPAPVLLSVTHALVKAIGRDRVRECPASNCGRLFVKIGRRKFCSERCQTKEHLKVYYSPEAIAARDAAEEGRDVHTKTR